MGVGGYLILGPFSRDYGKCKYVLAAGGAAAAAAGGAAAGCTAAGGVAGGAAAAGGAAVAAVFAISPVYTGRLNRFRMRINLNRIRVNALIRIVNRFTQPTSGCGLNPG